MRRRILGNRRSGNVVLQTPTDGLLASYEMNGNANDSWGIFHGTENNVTYSEAEANFNGVDSYITLPSNLLVNPTVFSISLFVQANNFNTEQRYLTLNSNTNAPYISMRITTGGVLTTTINASEGIGLQAKPTSYDALEKNHVLIRINNSGTSQILVNGILGDTVFDSITKTFTYNEISSPKNNVIGGARNMTLLLNGSMSKINIYNKYLTNEEMSILYNGGLGTKL